MTNIPEITEGFMKEIEYKAKKGNYEIKVNDIPITVFPYVFPAVSKHSKSKINVEKDIEVKGKKILDLGTGTGILAIESIIAGAEYVEAVDIYSGAVECAKYNVKTNMADRKVEVYPSNVFSNVRGRFDIILANLPILDIPEKDIRKHALTDPNWKYHRRLFEQASLHLKSLGTLVCHHANLQPRSFRRLEELASENRFKIRILKKTKALGYDWKLYEFSLD